MSWEKIKFGDIAEFSNGVNFDKSAYGKGIKLINVSNFGNRYYPEYDELSEIKKDIVRDVDLLNEGDIIFVRSNGNKELVGRCMLIRKSIFKATFSGFCIRARIKEQNKYLPEYFTYFFKSKIFRKEISGNAVGTNIQNLSQTRLKNDLIPVPDYDVQCRIADILLVYDELLENNQKQIKLLEDAAQRLYKEWFVDLHFPGYENTRTIEGVPEGWKKCTLNDVIIFDPKVQLKKDDKKVFIPMSALSTSSMVLDSSSFNETYSNSGSKFNNGDTLLARITPCLENGKTAFVWNIPDSGAVGSTEYIVMRSKQLNPYMVYLLARTKEFRQYAINSMSGSDGRQRVKSDKLKTLPTLLPASNIKSLFEQLVSPMFMEIYLLSSKCNHLIEARDRLLPKLMSGEIEV